MKKIALAILTVSCFTLTGCGEEAAYGSAFTNSESAWLTAKSQNGHAYLYRVEKTSTDGSGELTSLTVADGAVIERVFKRYDDLDFRMGLTAEWAEGQGDVGAHEEGAAALTVDDLYDTCQDSVLNKGEGFDIIFEVDARGLLKTCTYRPAGCSSDACSLGIQINEVIFMTEMGG
jgi:hypothetical protein